MKIYLPYNVYEAAKKRIHRLYDEFDHVVVTFSGGKDSTVLLEVALEVARERGELPLDVMFLDQEAEWYCVIEYIRRVFARDEVRGHWLQVPVRLFNATSHEQDGMWLYCWEEGKQWMRELEPDSLREDLGVIEFIDIFPAWIKREYGTDSVALMGGVRCEESPNRYVGLTQNATYRDITWGKIYSKKNDQYAFYPIYDWEITDVWKAIHDNGWDYAEVYDWQYQYGVPVRNMRVSNLHHQTAIASLWYLQEMEPQTWAALCRRLPGIHSTKMTETVEAYRAPKDLPYMFSSWQEYRDYLLKTIIGEQPQAELFRKKFSDNDEKYAKICERYRNWMCRVHVNMILANDIELVLIKNWEGRFEVGRWRQWMRGKYTGEGDEKNFLSNPCIQGSIAEGLVDPDLPPPRW